MATTMADKAAKLLCMHLTINELTSKELNALHILKHEVIAGIFRLYQELPPKKADPLLDHFFGELLMTAVEADIQDGHGGQSGGQNPVI